jgi:MFS family permease
MRIKNWSSMIVLLLINFNEAVQGNVIWPFLPFAVQKFGAKSEEVGLWVGILAASFYAGQACTITFWGQAADYFGRRPVLLLGLVGTMFAQVLFGLAKSFYVALLARTLAGMLNGNVAIAKVYVAETCQKEQLASGFSLISFTWGLGTIVAPAVGSYLADPAAQYPGSFLDVPFLREFPYFLPSFVSICTAIIAIAIGFFALPETEVFVRMKAQRNRRSVQASNARSSARAQDEEEVELSIDLPRSSAGDRIEEIKGPSFISRVLNALTPSITRRQQYSKLGDATVATSEEELDSDNEDVEIELPAIRSPTLTLKESDGIRKRTLETEGSTEVDAANVTLEDFEPVTPASPAKPAPTAAAPSSLPESSPVTDDVTVELSTSQMLRLPAVGISIVCYAFLAICQIIFDECLSIFMETPVVDYGLGMNVQDIGRIQIFQGLTQITFTLFVVPWVLDFGALHCFRYSLLPMVFLVSFPITHEFLFNSTLLWVMLAFYMFVKQSLMNIAFSAIILAINNSSRGKSLGVLNGIAQTVASLVRALGPAFGGALFSASLSFSFMGRFRLWSVYIVMGVFIVMAWLFSYRLPLWINDPPDYSEKKASESNGEIPDVDEDDIVGVIDEHEEGEVTEKGEKKSTERQARDDRMRGRASSIVSTSDSVAV